MDEGTPCVGGWHLAVGDCGNSDKIEERDVWLEISRRMMHQWLMNIQSCASES